MASLLLKGLNMNVTEVNDSELIALLAMSDLPVLVDFYSPYCGACGQFATMMDIVAQRYDGKLKVVKIDAFRNKQVSSKLKPNLPMPTSAIYYRGKLVDTYEGAPTLLEIYQPFLNGCFKMIEQAKNGEHSLEIPFGYKLLRDTTLEQRSWMNEIHSDRGPNHLTCSHCLRVFHGNAKRTICRTCEEDIQNPPI